MFVYCIVMYTLDILLIKATYLLPLLHNSVDPVTVKHCRRSNVQSRNTCFLQSIFSRLSLLGRRHSHRVHTVVQ